MWIRALRYAIAGRHAESLDTLRLLFAIHKCGPPSPSVLVDFNLLTALEAARVGDFSLSQSAIAVSLNQLDAAKRTSAADRDYLKYYCKTLLSQYADQMGPEGESLLESIDINYESINLTEVSAHHRLNFPI